MIKDGQHRYDGTQYNCFFCMKNKTNCKAVVLPAGVSTGIGPFDKLLHQHEGTQYPACQECWAKGQLFLVETVCDYLRTKYETIRQKVMTGILDQEAKSLMTAEEIKLLTAARVQ